MFPRRLRPLIPYLKRYWLGLALGTMCVLFTQGIAVQAPRVIQRLIDDFTKGATWQKLATYAGLFVGIYAGMSFWVAYASHRGDIVHIRLIDHCRHGSVDITGLKLVAAVLFPKGFEIMFGLWMLLA